MPKLKYRIEPERKTRKYGAATQNSQLTLISILPIIQCENLTPCDMRVSNREKNAENYSTILCPYIAEYKFFRTKNQFDFLRQCDKTILGFRRAL